MTPSMTTKKKWFTRFGILFALTALPGMALAIGGRSAVWKHTATQAQCVSDAEAAFAVSNLTDTRQGGAGTVWGDAGEYLVCAACTDGAASLTVMGPRQSVVDSLYERVRRNWR